ncbi:histidine kinase [Actinoplanes sp. NPDC051633]|uniref:sensor histidine kinase n=1 Tax=Actinoplanes sp. NPDC051633 TaxID=3155670 RepID=UPI003413ABD6
MGSPAVTEYRWLLPAVLVADPDEHRRVRRSTRDWVIDSLCFLIGFGFTLLVTVDLLSGGDLEAVPGWADTPLWLVWTDFALGTVFAIGLFWRRRHPVRLALAVLVVGVFSLTNALTALILLFSVAVHRRFSVVAAIMVASIAVTALFTVVRQENGTGFVESFGWSVVFMVIVVLWGMVVRSRRQLVVSLRDRAERAESEQQLRVAQARSLERTRIAREMHDVLAHRISLLSLHAGALEIRPDASADEVAGAAGVIRASAHQALQDLREVIGVLRADTGEETAPERPQPTIADLPALADESRAAGMRVRLELTVAAGDVPALTGRTAYRIVQEALTNARKHAPGAAVTVAIGGAPGAGLAVAVSNPWPVSPPAAIPGTGTGLIGLAERTTLAGGRLTHGRTESGDFALTAWLPWPA